MQLFFKKLKQLKRLRLKRFKQLIQSKQLKFIIGAVLIVAAVSIFWFYASRESPVEVEQPVFQAKEHSAKTAACDFYLEDSASPGVCNKPWLEETKDNGEIDVKLKSATEAGVQTFQIKPTATLALYDGKKLAAISQPRFEYSGPVPNQWIPYQITGVKVSKESFDNYVQITQNIQTEQGDPITFEYQLGFDGKQYIKKQTWSIEADKEVRLSWQIEKIQTENLNIDYSDFEGKTEVVDDTIYFYPSSVIARSEPAGRATKQSLQPNQEIASSPSAPRNDNGEEVRNTKHLYVIDPAIWIGQTSTTITVQTDNFTTSDFKLVFNQDDAGISEAATGTGSTWSSNFLSATELLTELDQDTDYQVDKTSTLTLLENTGSRTIVKNKFSLGSEADVTEYWHIYPSGKLHKYIKYVKNLAGTEDRKVDDGATDLVNSGMYGYHPSTPSTTRAGGTYYWDAQLIELIENDTGEITDYQSPGAPSMTTGTLLNAATTNAWGDDDNDGFNEGRGGYEIRGAASGTYRADFTIDGSTTNRYKPIFNFHEFYPTTGGAQTTHTLSHLRLDNDATNQGTGADGTANGIDYSTATSTRGYSAFFDANTDYVSLDSTDAIDEDEGTIEFWYRSEDDYDAASTQKIFFGNSTTTGTNIYIEEDGDNDLVFHYIDDSENDHIASTSLATALPYKAEEWNHFKFVWDIDAGAGHMQIAINGQQVDETYTLDGSFTATTFASSTMYIGNYSTNSAHANGYIDEFYIFDENVLTATNLNQPIVKKDGAVLTEGTDYNISRTPETASYVIQYLSNVTTNAQFQFAEGLSTNVLTWTETSFSDDDEFLKGTRINNNGDAMVSFNEFEYASSTASSTVGLWHMNESSEAANEGGQSVIDYSGSGNDGIRGSTSTDPKWTISRNAALGDSGLYFDGSDDYVKVASTTDLAFADTQDFTIEGWFRVDADTGNPQNIVIRYDSNSSYLVQVQDISCNIWFQIEGEDSANTATAIAANNYCDGKYHHFAAVLDAGSTLYLYIDGTLQDTDTDDTSGKIGQNDDLNFGYYATGSTQPLQGSIDDIRFWNDIRTQTEIETNMLNEMDTSDSSLIGYWKMDASGQTLTDAKGSNDGYLATSTDLSASDPKRLGHGRRYDNNESDPPLRDLNYALDFDGSDDYVFRADDADFDFAAADAFTIEGWFKHDTITTNPDYILTKSQDGANAGYQVYMASDGDIVFKIDDNTSWDSVTTTAATYDDDKWHHFAATKDGTTGIYLFIDGVEIDSNTSIGATGSLVNDDPLYIGVDDDGSSNAFDGILDELRISNSIRYPTGSNFTPPATFTSDANTVGLWKFNDPQDRTNDLDVALDESGNNNTGTLGVDTADGTDDPTWKPADDGPPASDGYVDGALDFDSTNSEYVNIGNVYNGVKTIEFWTKLDSTTEKILDLSNNQYVEVSAGTLDLVGDAGETIYVDGTASASIDTDWHYVAITTETGINATSTEIGRKDTTYGNAIVDELRLSNIILPISNITRYKTSGTIASEVKDFGATGTTTEISWNAITTGDNEGTVSKLEVRASETIFGQASTTPAWAAFDNPVSPISSNLPAGRYMQWRFTMTPKSDTNKTESPILQDVTVKYYITSPPTEPSIIYSAQDGNWSSTATWDGGAIPDSDNQVFIQHNVTLDQNATTMDITIDSGGKLDFDTSGDGFTLQINESSGDALITIGATDGSSAGELECRSPTTAAQNHTIELNSSTGDATVGIQVETDGSLDIQGTSASDQDCIITNGGSTLDGTRDGYIYLKDGSETKIENAEISYLGANSSNKYGIYANANDFGTNEALLIKDSIIHNNYDGINLDTCTGAILQDNLIYDNSNVGIVLSGSSNNTIIANVIDNSTSHNISLINGDTNNIYNNTIYGAGDDGIALDANSSANKIKNNIITNSTNEGADDDMVSSTNDYNYNLYANNTGGNCSPTADPPDCDKNAVTTAPTYVSTVETNADYMYLAEDSAGLGSGVNLFTDVADTSINIGARLGLAINDNAGSNNKYNWLQQAHDDASLGAEDTVTSYAKDYFSDTITAASSVGSYFVKFDINSTTNIDAANEYEGVYMYMTSGLNKGKYYLITDSTDATPDTITIYSPDDAATTFTPDDGFTVVDRVYAKGATYNLSLTEDGTATSPITWNTSGTVIVDAEDTRQYGIYGVEAKYNIIDGFIIEGATSHGMYLLHPTKNKVINNVVHNNSADGINISSSAGKDAAIIDNNTSFSNTSEGLYISGNNYSIYNNTVYSNDDEGIEIIYDNNIIKSNVVFDSEEMAGIHFSGDADNNTAISNISFTNNGSDTYYGYGFLVWTGAQGHVLYNNVSVGNTTDGIMMFGNSNTIYNNILAYNTDDGLDENAANTDDYNAYFENGTEYEGSSQGSNKVTIDPEFYWEVASTTDVESGTTQYIYDSTYTWTENEWVGAGVYVQDGAGDCPAGAEGWYGVISNSASRLFLAPAASAAISSLCDYGITNFYVDEDSPVLAAGATTATSTDVLAGNQPATPQINMGARLGYIKNSTDSEEFNWLQQAEDAAGYGPGDTLNVYGYEYVASSTILAISDQGPYATTTALGGPIWADNDYEGMYMFMTSGTNNGNYYLIIDSEASSTVAILTDAVTGFSVGDSFKIVDRLYDRQGDTTNGANLGLSTWGEYNNYITWDAQGTAIITADDNDSDVTADWAYNVFGESGLNYVKWDKDFKTSYVAGSTSQIGGTYNDDDSNYYIFGSYSASGVFSLQGWVRPSNSITFKALFVKDVEYRMISDGSDKLACQVFAPGGWQTGATSSAALILNSWNYVACTYDRSNIKVYVNGILAGTQTMSSVDVHNATSTLELGYDESGSYSDYQGWLDEFKFYKYARSASQIKADYAGPAPRGDGWDIIIANHLRNGSKFGTFKNQFLGD